MNVLSVNIAERRTIQWKGEDVETGIFKKAVTGYVTIDETGVYGDHVIDRKYHGSPDMAAYIYSAKWYPFWKEKYPELDWENGMFGENITVSGLDESQLNIGDVLQIGSDLLLQVAQPRQPCFKLGVKFGTQKIIKDFIAAPYPGIYVRVLQPGDIQAGDEVEIIDSIEDGLAVLKVWDVMYNANRSEEDVELLLNDPFLSGESKESLKRKMS